MRQRRQHPNEGHMMALSRAQLKQFRQQLLTVRGKIAGEIKSIAEETSKSPREASGDLSAYTVHMADMAADAYEREVSMNIVSSEQEVLYQIDDALKRMEEGAFGTCQQCNKPIAMTRLKAVPYASLCIQCQRDKERKSKR